jgi:replication-associated recombination protein RarA
MDLFERSADQDSSLESPLTDWMRPQFLEEFIGQDHISAKGSLL